VLIIVAGVFNMDSWVACGVVLRGVQRKERC